MYSNSPAFLGGRNSSRPGPPNYNQPSFQNQQQAPQHLNVLPQQPTSYGPSPVQAQFTGLPLPNQLQNFQTPLQQQQSQFTGLPPQSPQSFQNPAYQQQGQQAGQIPQPQLISQRTGHTSSQIAQSFQSAGSAEALAKPAATGVKIPKIRLSFLTASDQAKFEQLFKSAVGDGQALDGDKVRELLVRSKLRGTDLMHIWVLSDTTKSGQLLFPEFALAMYLCNSKLLGKELPQVVPERIANEVSSMVDIISFGVPDERPQVDLRSNALSFDTPARSTASPQIQQPQPQTSNTQLLAQMTAQPTGFASQYIPPQATGFQQQPPVFSPQHTNIQQQQTGLQPNPQAIGYSGLRPPMPLMPNSSFSQLQGSGPPALPLNAQPTERPGQWGLVNAPATGLPNIEALQQRMMPQPGRESGYTTAGLSGTATIPWAVTKTEKKLYDDIFRAWDGLNKGFIGGDVAREVMGQSGLGPSDLGEIWTLSDPGNKGRLDMDEFAVAMHLIYRKLNGYPVPARLPPELVPPSTRNFTDSIGAVKSLLSQDAEVRKNTGAFLQPQKTGVSYLKTHSFRSGSDRTPSDRKDATVFRNNDDDIGYKSSARRRLGGDGRTPSPVQSSSSFSESSPDELSVEQIKKMIREKQVVLDAIDFKDENAADDDEVLDRKDRREAEDLYRVIRRIQEDIDSHPNAALIAVDSGAEKRTLQRKLQALTDKLPELASNVRRTERSIAEAKLELFRLKDAKAHPKSAAETIGTGPGGVVTEADRLKSRAKAMMQQRSAALRGKPIIADVDNASAAATRLDQENSTIRSEKENNEHMIKDVEDSVRDFSRSIESSLKDGDLSSQSDYGRRRWEEGLGVENEVKDFIFDLQRSSQSARIRQKNTYKSRDDQSPHTLPRNNESNRDTSVPSSSTQSGVSSALKGGSTYSSYKTAEERATFIKQQAEQRMAERLAALGLKPPSKPGESAQQRQEREARERDERMHQAEAEDMKRNQERQRRLAEEQPSPPDVTKSANKKPPPPPSHKSRAESLGQQAEVKRRADEDAQKQRAEQEGKELAIRKQQEAQEAETKKLQDEAERQEEELDREREAARSRLRALEDQVQAGKIKKQEGKRRKQAAETIAKEKEAKLAAQRAELEAAKERERQLQLQLESLEDDSSDDEDPRDITPQETTPTHSQIFTKPETPPSTVTNSVSGPPPISEVKQPELSQGAFSDSSTVPVSTSVYSSETKNPFFKKLGQLSGSNSGSTSQAASSITSPSANELSTNPFHRMAQQENSAKTVSGQLSTPTGNRPSRVRPEDDEWSVDDSTKDSSDDEEDDKPTGGSAKYLASILLGTMAPSRPHSAMDEQKSPMGASAAQQVMTPTIYPATPSIASTDTPFAAPTSPPPMLTAQGAPGGPPPPPPPMPPIFGSSPSAPPPPPPPPPMGAGAGAGAGPPAVNALLGAIVKGKGLKKVETRDRSQASSAGRVLN